MLTFDQIYADVRELDARLDGSAAGPGDESWDAARAAWNLAVDQRPAMVVTPRSVADVVAVVNYARERRLRVAPQGTGHSAAALGSLERTVLLKTTELRGVEIDAERKVARVQAGDLWMDVTGPAAAHGLTGLAGSAPDVGVVGYTLGGGFCYLGRKYGFASNSVLAVEMVLADGRAVRVTADSEPELFWAVRGGGGSFGVVTALEMALYDLPEVYATSLFFPIERGSEILHAWREYVDTLPDETTSYARFLQLPPIPDIPEALRGGRFIHVEVVHLGGEADGLAAAKPMRDLGPQIELGGSMDTLGLSKFHMDPEHPVPGVGGAHLMLEKLDAEAIDAFVGVAGADSKSPLLFLELRQLGGALAEAPAGAGARDTFDAPFAMYGVGMAMDVDMAIAVESHLEKAAATMAPWDGGSRYLNFVDHPADTRLMFSAEAYARLRQVKAAVDPGDVIQSNHPIHPAL